MTGMMIVSHSRKAAEGAREMALAMSGGDIDIIAVGGTIEGSLGTDFDAILDGLKKLSEKGDAVVLVDLGSAVMSVQAAMEQMSEEKGRIELLDAPLLEGAVMVAVQASAGAGMDELIQIAEASWSMRKLV